MTTPSFERIDYQLRYNKHIERKLIFDVLVSAKPLVEFSRHRYLGFGSMWFSDFRLAHRILGLQEMISMEKTEYADRAAFNQPYRSIDVKPGNSTTILENFSESNWASPFICWLDYDGGLGRSVVKDLELVLQKFTANSVLIVTVNASRRSYRPIRSGADIDKTRIGTALGEVENLLGPGTVPSRFEPGITEGNVHLDVSEYDFPEFMAEALLSFMSHKVALSGRRIDSQEGETVKSSPITFVPLFNFCHKDGAEMITVGGAIVAAKDESLWQKAAALGDFSPTQRFPRHQRLDLIPITLKEKIVLDKCLPYGKEEFLGMAKRAGVKLDDDELAKYFYYYQHFPIFFEAPL